VRRSALERRKEAIKKEAQKVETDLDGLFRLMLGGEYNPTQKDFIYDPTRIKGYMGPAGAAKTSTIVAAGMGRALLQPGSRGFFSRCDYNDLMETTMRRAEEMLSRLPKGVLLDRDKSPPMRWYIAPAIPDGEASTITFMGLQDTVVGIEANWWAIDEMNEIEEKRAHEVNMRLRGLGGNFSLMGAFNPPPKTHWLYPACTGFDFQEKRVCEPWIKLFKPVPRENVQNLPENYYENLSKTLSTDLIQRYVEGQWGSTFEGQPVYREFKGDVHVKDRLQWTNDRPLLRFWDFGYNRPACIWAQIDWEGHLLCFRELIGQFEEATAFAKRVIANTTLFFPGASNILDFGDPAVRQQKDTGKTAFELAKEGITIRWQITTIDWGVKMIRKRLETLIDGKAALQFDHRFCPILIDAMKGGYRLDRMGEKPYKDGFYEHVADAFRYGVVNVLGGSNQGNMTSENLPASIEYDPHFDTWDH
jgi:hypothetical protein